MLRTTPKFTSLFFYLSSHTLFLKSIKTELLLCSYIVIFLTICFSVSAGKLLPVDKYLLYSVNKRDGTKLKFRGAGVKTSLDGDSLDSCKSIISKISNSEDAFKGGELFVPHLSKHEYNRKANPSLKAGDPNFISEYYAHSRLHHLSMWKAELKKFTADIQKRKKLFVGEPVKKNPDRLVMHVDMDSFFVSVALTVDQSLKGKPIAVCHSNKSNG